MASELEVGKLKVAATDGAGGLVHENASGIKVGTDSNTTIGFIGTLSNHPLKLLANNDGKVTIATNGDATFTGTTVVPRLGVVSSSPSYELYNNANTYLNGTTTLNGLATCNNGITVSGGFTTLGSFSEVTISGGGITVTSSTHRVDTQNDDPSDQLSSISGGTDGSILVLQSVTSTRDVTVTHSNGTSPQNIHLAGGASFTLDTSNDVLVLIKYGSIWREVSRSDNS